jgi:hypothetical protein
MTRPRTCLRNNCGAQFLVVALMLAMWSDSLERGAEGEPVRGADNAAPSQEQAGWLLQLLAGLPGLLPLLLNKLCSRLDRPPRVPSKKEDAAAQRSEAGGGGVSVVARVHQDPPALTTLRHTVRGASGESLRSRTHTFLYVRPVGSTKLDL